MEIEQFKCSGCENHLTMSFNSSDYISYHCVKCRIVFFFKYSQEYAYRITQEKISFDKQNNLW